MEMSRERDEEGEYIYHPDEQYEDDREVSQEIDFKDWQQEAGESGEEEAAKAKPRNWLVKRSAREDVEEEGDYYDSQLHEFILNLCTRFTMPTILGLQLPNSFPPIPVRGVVARSLPCGRGGGEGEKEMNEMWDFDGQDSEVPTFAFSGALHRLLRFFAKDDVPRTRDDDDFIDDTGEDEVQYTSVGDEPAGSSGEAPQAEEAHEHDELKKYFQPGKKRNKQTKRPAEKIAMIVEQFMARLVFAAEDDVYCNRSSQPAINKLKMLPELVLMLKKSRLQQEFMDRGVLSVLKNWLEPLPDGSLPNLNIRSTVLKLLTDFPIDVEQHERREQLKKSGIGKVLIFLSKLPDETRRNRKLARDLLDRWSGALFAKGTGYEDVRQMDADKALPMPKTYRPFSLATLGSGTELIENVCKMFALLH